MTISRSGSAMKFHGFRTSLCLAVFGLFASAQPARAAGDVKLSVDWTVGIQFVIFLVALYFLNALVFRPLLDVRERRERLTEGTLAEAERVTEKARVTVAEYEKRIAEARNRATEIRNELRQRGQEEASRMLADARAAAQAELERKRTALEEEVSKMKSGLGPEIDALAEKICERILEGGTESG